MSNIIPVILSGGVGSRLWPLSREAHPKPFIRLEDGQSLIQKAYLRARSLENVSEVLTVTNRELFFYAKDEYEAVQCEAISHPFILEPFGRNSAAAIASACHYVVKNHGKDAVALILSADHLIEKQTEFIKAVDEAIALVDGGQMVTFGLTPDAPKTGYGYIHADGNKVLEFVEKPDLETAKSYLAQGNYYWNSGIFCFNAQKMLDEMSEHASAIGEQTRICLENATCFEGDNWSQIEINGDDFAAVEDISIDYAIFEKSKNIAVVPCEMGWSDIGTWNEFGELSPKDAKGNHIAGEVALEDVANCIIHSKDRIVAGVGLENLVIADTKDALLIADRNRVQDVKAIVKELKSRDHETYQLFPTAYRPWGNYTILQEAAGFKIKRIEVTPGASLSLQKHRHRSEHWVIVQGQALIVNGEEEFLLEVNQSTYIPVGNMHRLANPTKNPLIMIEVQCGDYLGEDDIERFDDIYGR